MKLRLRTKNDDYFEALRNTGYNFNLSSRIMEISKHLVIGNVFYKYRTPLVERYDTETGDTKIYAKLIYQDTDKIIYEPIDDMEFIIVDGSSITKENIEDYHNRNIILV